MGKHRRPENPQETTAMGPLLRLEPGRAGLSAIDPASTPGFEGGKDAGRAAMADFTPGLADLQERLYAHGRTGGSRRVLLVLQGMDTSGKGGVSRHVLGQVDPQGVSIASFGAPTEEERAHDFLWRVEKQVPRPGRIGVFDRSHYEDIVAVRVKGLAAREVWEPRYDRVNAFESVLADSGCLVLKVFLHISQEESKSRLLARLDDPTKHWKYNPADIDDRALWADFQAAYDDVLARCGTVGAPWYVVPADKKWYRNYAVTALLVEALEGLGLQWPQADFDVAAERARLEAAP